MVGKELAIRKVGPVDLREVAAKTTLRDVRLKGHTYVELRHAGKRIIFFCTICLTPCYSDTVLFDHLKGNLHARRYAAAKVTLFGPVPWPFNDGVLFFNNIREKDLLLLALDSQKKALVVRSETVDNENEVTSRLRDDLKSQDRPFGISSNVNKVTTNGNGDNHCSNGHKKPTIAVNGHKSSGNGGCLIIPGVLLKEVVSNLRVRFLGIGNVAYKINENIEAKDKVTKIWCAWSGQEASDGSEEMKDSHQCDFAIVNFVYTYDLGRKWGPGDQDPPLSPSSFFMIDDLGHWGKKRKKSFSDHENSSEHNSSSNSPSENGSGPDGCSADSSSHLQIARLSSKSARKELRKQKRLCSERACDICGQPILPGKDVATLLNCKTGNLACSSRNTNGAFHLFHASCLVHWILLCEYELLVDQSNSIKSIRGRKARTALRNKISSILCPECQGTGIHIEGQELEKPTVSLSEMFLYKLKALEAHKAWMKNPEVLQKCSTGLYFPHESEENAQEKVMPLKLLHFYRADE
ncbi:uncharacterized protein LOC109713626 [Ananas comosus]|uniref:Uncharacterized protein LOC109713626 n=1 Tax=Ananas comosus TaxID=4615 RepID=A0A6P5FJK6_ANACO|nr:uncharacterized protein LOC109713626 [Ananas comosus]